MKMRDSNTVIVNETKEQEETKTNNNVFNVWYHEKEEEEVSELIEKISFIFQLKMIDLLDYG